MQKLTFRQHGAALIIFVAMLVLVTVSLVISQASSSDIKMAREKKTVDALAEAKTALIGYAVTYDDDHSGELYGYLPCPDISPTDPSGEGAQSICGNLGVSALGRLPWKTLKMQPIKDGDGECLWYAVSGSYKNNPKTAGITPNTLGLLAVLNSDGSNFIATSPDPAVAVVFSPSVALPSQDRSQDVNAQQCDGNYTASNYLDTDLASNTNNAVISNVVNGISTFIAANDSEVTASTVDNFNDKLVIIRRSEIFAAYCKKYANALLNNVSGSNNACNNNTSTLESCNTLTGYLQNCQTSCRDAATALVSTACLTDITSAACQAAINSLEVCHA
ncbi:MAG: hypothetical protein SFU55_11365 [Methylophilus sp.]|nr:hypothetical protein [Methylophilus sp.]